MRTWLMADIQRLPHDDVIAHAIERERYSAEGQPQCVGIRNRAGQIYRLVHVQGMGQRIRIIRLFQKLGFVEEDFGSPVEGCCATFRLSPANTGAQ